MAVRTWVDSSIDVIELANDVLRVKLLSVGASLWDLRPASDPATSLCLSLAGAADYRLGAGYIGVTAGPVANRIGGAVFEIEGEQFRLEANEGRNQLHGGPTGFSHKEWETHVDPHRDQVRFTLHRPDGEGGYPGNLNVVVTYTLDGNRLRYEWAATTDRSTPVSLANHAYWNLAGADTIAAQLLQVPASRIVAVDTDSIPTGELMAIDGSPYDLRRPTTVGSAVEALGDGIDHCYVLDDTTGSGAAGPVILIHPPSGRRLEITTTLPGVQVYTGQFLDGSPRSGGYGKHSGLCLETQHLPDAVNNPSFPSCLVHPGQPITHRTDYVFRL